MAPRALDTLTDRGEEEQHAETDRDVVGARACKPAHLVPDIQVGEKMGHAPARVDTNADVVAFAHRCEEKRLHFNQRDRVDDVARRVKGEGSVRLRRHPSFSSVDEELVKVVAHVLMGKVAAGEARGTGGGEIRRRLRTRPRLRPWQIAVEEPFDERPEEALIVVAVDGDKETESSIRYQQEQTPPPGPTTRMAYSPYAVDWRLNEAVAQAWLARMMSEVLALHFADGLRA